MIKPLLLLPIPALLFAQSVRLDVSSLELRGVVAESVQYKGAKAIRLIEKAGNTGDAVAIANGASFRDGTLEIDVAGLPAAGAPDSARGFIGVAFHMKDGGTRYECLYIRPTNARSSDQLRRNHTTQYISVPDRPWERLRQESPGVYESYADMVAREWTHLRIVVHGTEASLYVGQASQPSLLIHDLRPADSAGRVGLWIGPGTEGYFKDLVVNGQ